MASPTSITASFHALTLQPQMHEPLPAAVEDLAAAMSSRMTACLLNAAAAARPSSIAHVSVLCTAGCIQVLGWCAVLQQSPAQGLPRLDQEGAAPEPGSEDEVHPSAQLLMASLVSGVVAAQSGLASQLQGRQSEAAPEVLMSLHASPGGLAVHDTRSEAHAAAQPESGAAPAAAALPDSRTSMAWVSPACIEQYQPCKLELAFELPATSQTSSATTPSSTSSASSTTPAAAPTAASAPTATAVQQQGRLPVRVMLMAQGQPLLDVASFAKQGASMDGGKPLYR